MAKCTYPTRPSNIYSNYTDQVLSSIDCVYYLNLIISNCTDGEKSYLGKYRSQ